MLQSATPRALRPVTRLAIGADQTGCAKDEDDVGERWFGKDVLVTLLMVGRAALTLRGRAEREKLMRCRFSGRVNTSPSDDTDDDDDNDSFIFLVSPMT